MMAHDHFCQIMYFSLWVPASCYACCRWSERLMLRRYSYSLWSVSILPLSPSVSLATIKVGSCLFVQWLTWSCQYSQPSGMVFLFLGAFSKSVTMLLVACRLSWYSCLIFSEQSILTCLHFSDWRPRSLLTSSGFFPWYNTRSSTTATNTNI